MFYINKGNHDNPHGLPKDNLEGSQVIVHHDYTHIDIPPKMPEEIEKLEFINYHFQDHEKVYGSDPQVVTEPIHDTLYPKINNDNEYGLFENVIDVPKLVTHVTPQQVHCIQTHPVHTHMIIFHNNLTP